VASNSTSVTRRGLGAAPGRQPARPRRASNAVDDLAKRCQDINSVPLARASCAGGVRPVLEGIVRTGEPKGPACRRTRPDELTVPNPELLETQATATVLGTDPTAREIVSERAVRRLRHRGAARGRAESPSRDGQPVQDMSQQSVVDDALQAALVAPAWSVDPDTRGDHRHNGVPGVLKRGTDFAPLGDPEDRS